MRAPDVPHPRPSLTELSGGTGRLSGFRTACCHNPLRLPQLGLRIENIEGSMETSERLATVRGEAQESSSGDEPLLRAVRRGDSQAFADLYERHRAAVLAVAGMHASSREEAEDITSEAFTRVFALLKSG